MKGASEKFQIEASDLLEVIEATVRQVVAQMFDAPESCTFSGDPADVTVTDKAIFLRLQRTSVVDEEGVPHELHARLCGTSGLYAIPNVKTEVLVFHVAGAGSVAGSAWCIFGTTLPTGVTLGNITAGRAVLAPPAGNSAILFGADDSISVRVPDLASGQDMLSTWSPTDGIRHHTPWGKESLSSRGKHIVLAGGARLDLGAYDLPGFGSIRSYARIKAASVTVCGTAATKIGRGPFFSAAVAPAPGPFGVAGIGSTSVVIGG